MGGKVETEEEQLWHSARPHFRQWCYRQTDRQDTAVSDSSLHLTEAMALVPTPPPPSTCLHPSFLMAHIPLTFQKKGPPHFSHTLLAVHSGV